MVLSLHGFCALVPIRVGMILTKKEDWEANFPCPHTRGDDPKVRVKTAISLYLSPYAWG